MMRSWIGICSATLVAAATLATSDTAAAAPASTARRLEIGHAAVAPATDLSARRRADRHLRHPRRAQRAAKRPAYYARPSYYRPDGMAPFFPFHYGYGLEPSW